MTGAPSNLTATRLNLTSVLLSWSPSLTVDVLGYEVFYDDDAKRLSEVVDGATQEAIIQSIKLDSNYTVFVVAFGGNLPSEYSNVVTISTGR